MELTESFQLVTYKAIELYVHRKLFLQSFDSSQFCEIVVRQTWRNFHVRNPSEPLRNPKLLSPKGLLRFHLRQKP